VIDPETPEGDLFRKMTRALHERRTGRDGSRRWDRTLLDNKVERPGLELLHAYFRGDPPLRRDIHDQWKPYVRAFLRAGRLNFATKTCTATSNRMELYGFRTAAASDEFGDQQAADIMAVNEYELLSSTLHDHMLGMGDAYTITTPPTADMWPRITAEDPRQVITVEHPVTKQTIAGLKLYRDEWDSADYAFFAMRYESGQVMVARLRKKGVSSMTDGPWRFNANTWELDESTDPITEASGQMNPATFRSPGDVMPFDRFQNRFGVGEFEWHLDTLDRINDKIFNEWWTTKVQAFRQRAVKNLPDTERRKNDTTGKIEEVELDYDDMFTAAPDEMWRVPADVEFWESTPVDVTPIIAGVQKDLERYAGAVDLPLHTITPDAANGSAEGATLMREEHVFKIRDRKRRVQRRHASVMSKAFLFMGDEARADVTRIEAIWGPDERFSLAQMADAAQKVKGILPTEAILTDIMQYRPSDLPRLRELAGNELIRQMLEAAQTAALAPAPAPAEIPAAQ
jgi:hypothetical protein